MSETSNAKRFYLEVRRALEQAEANPSMQEESLSEIAVAADKFLGDTLR